MRALFLIPALLALAAPAGAQTDTADFFPLEVGNRWVYTRTQVASTSPGNSQTTSLGTVEWNVVGEVQTSDGRVPLLTIGTTTCGLRADTLETGSVQYAFVAAENAPCASDDPYIFANSYSSEFLLEPDGVQNVTVGGINYPDRPFALGMDDRSIGGGYSSFAGWQGAAGIGLVSFATSRSDHFGSSTYRAVLQYAVVGGQEYGTRPTAGESGPQNEAALTAGPSPFQSQTTVRYVLPEASAARLDLTDALGRVVRQLDLGARPAGAGEVVVSAGGLAPGLYVARLVAGDRSATTRLAVVR